MSNSLLKNKILDKVDLKNKIYLKNSDFESGTYIIDKSGYYCLKENIVFNPNSLDFLSKTDPNINPCHSSRPTVEQLKDPEFKQKFNLGFFAAIAIKADYVVVDLNGFKLEQSSEHNLQQRFYSNIELANQPFLGGQGPSSFGDIIPANNVIIRNGKLGRSSHHGIHGNNNNNILIENLIFEEFEVAAISLNRSNNLLIQNNKIEENSKKVPVLGIFSAGRFIFPLVESLIDIKNKPLEKNGLKLEAREVYQELVNFLCTTYWGVLNKPNWWASNSKEILLNLKTGKTSSNIDEKSNEYMKVDPSKYFKLVHTNGITDGNVYGILIHAQGVAVHGQGSVKDKELFRNPSDME